MKRFILSSIVLISFIIFSIYYRGRNPSTISADQSSNTNTEPTPSPTDNQSTANISNTPLTSKNTPVITSKSGYKNGTFTGDVADAFYGNIQVQIMITNGKISDVQFLQYPNDRPHSISINQYAMPILKSETIQAQNINVDIVSGATDSSQAFIQSLQSALNKAKI
jgi:uncharacterized protein with FMN-binding domain